MKEVRRVKANPKYLSFYYENITELPDIKIERNKTALLVVDMQKHFLAKDGFEIDVLTTVLISGSIRG